RLGGDRPLGRSRPVTGPGGRSSVAASVPDEGAAMSDDRENTAADPGAIPGTSSGAEPAMRGEGEEASSRLVPAVALRAHELSTRDGEPSFPRQDQQPPGLTAPM